MASEGKEGGGSGAGGAKLSLSLSVDIPREHVEKLYPEELAGVIESKSSESHTVIVDVRNQDFEGGHIPGSVHQPFSADEQEAILADLVPKYKDKRRVVFVCMYGEQRSPAIATAYAFHQAETLSEDEGPAVCVLLGGFARYMRENWDDRSTKIADFDESMWIPEEGVEGRWVHKSEAVLS